MGLSCYETSQQPPREQNFCPRAESLTDRSDAGRLTIHLRLERLHRNVALRE